MPRVTDTAGIISKYINLDATIEEELREINPGSLPIYWDEEKKQCRDNLDRDEHLAIDFTEYGGEEPRGFHRHASTILETLMEQHVLEEKTVASVCHGAVINSVLYYFFGTELPVKPGFDLDNASVTAVRSTRKGPTIEVVNDTSHLAVD